MAVICRTELHGLVKKTQYMTAFCLNEFSTTAAVGAPSATQISWRDKIDNQRGAVLATELKNNSFKFAKWTAQSILAGADQMKIGFVSCTNPKNSSDHVILGMQFYRPTDFAQQVTLQEGQMWCMFRTFIAMIQKHKSPTDATGTSKYVIMRDPNKPIFSPALFIIVSCLWKLWPMRMIRSRTLVAVGRVFGPIVKNEGIH